MIPTRDQFVQQRERDWKALDDLVSGEPGQRARALHRRPPEVLSRVVSLYRAVCADLERARGQRYGQDLIDFLEGLAGRTHNAVYASPPYPLGTAGRFLLHELPATLRRNLGFFVVAALLFLVPLVVCFVGSWQSRGFAAQVLPESALSEMERMYARGFETRGSGVNTGMAGYYVQHNVGIAFRCFATGICFGLGSVFFLVYNGLLIGTVLGWVVREGHGENILTFVTGHGSFELTAIVIAGAAGLKMGHALIATGGLTRLGSLRSQARELGCLVVGAAVMLMIAALIEGYWSPSAIANPVKWTAAALLWSAVIAYFAMGGREHEVHGTA
jgi:uncharacterized membrane protein SpoIIM required for sporulation